MVEVWLAEVEWLKGQSWQCGEQSSGKQSCGEQSKVVSDASNGGR